MKKNVVIIGAGPAGLTAAYELLKRSDDFDVTILEESNQIGGISRTVTYNGNRMDIGGHRFFSKDDRVMNWWADLMPTQGAPAYDYRKLNRSVKTISGGPDPEREDRVMLMRNRISRIYYRKKFFDYPVKMNAATIRNMGFATTMEAGFSYLGSCVRKLPETSLENFYINRFGKKLYSMFFEGYTEKLWGRHPREISADWGSQRVKGLSVTAILKDIVQKHLPGKAKNRQVETSLIEEFYYPKYGPGQLWELAAEEVRRMGGRIVMNARATGLEYDSDTSSGGSAAAAANAADSAPFSVGTVVYEQNGERTSLSADIVISSMPVKDLVAAMQDVPAEMTAIAEGLPYRDFVTVGLLLKKMNLKNETDIPTLGNIVPDNWIYVQDTGIHLGRIQIFNNWSPYMVEHPEETVWIGLEYFCAEGDELWSMPDRKWAQMAMKELHKMGILAAREDVLDFHCERVKKAYPAYFDTYAQFDTLRKWLDRCDNLYCIGRNGQHRYNNMDHSMETAFQTVDNILSGHRDRTNIWEVNTEKEYHEAKA